MIISHAHRFVFFHNPKAGGTSVRATIEGFNDIGFGLWGAKPEQTRGVTVDRAHLGIDEFAGYYPELWEKARDYAKFCLLRDPQARFLSSVAEHSKLHGDTDIRFSTPSQRLATLMAMVERLDKLGQAEAEALMQDYELTHFRPQWIYWGSADPAVQVSPFAVENMAGFFGEIETLTGQPLDSQTRNTREQLDLPGPLASLAASGKAKRLLTRMPGAGAAKDLLRRRFTAKAPQKGGFELTPAQADEIASFVRRFYAEDVARWPI